jgi:hypothetical protein
MSSHQRIDAYATFKTNFAHDPRCIVDYPAEVGSSVEPTELDAVRLTLAQRKFATGMNSIGMVRLLADRNGITAIETVDDLVPLLYDHQTFTSYPQSWLETNDFKRLTKWLQTLCAADLLTVDTTGCALIEDWMTTLLDQSTIDLQITASADGKAAFLPRSRNEWHFLHRLNLWNLQTTEGLDGKAIGLRPGTDRVPLIYLGARRGARSMSRFLDFYEASFGTGLVDTMLAHNDSDLLSLAGRIRAASKKGDAGLLQIKPELLARKNEIARLNDEAPKHREALVQRLTHDYRNQRIICYGTMQEIYNLAIRFRELGVTGAYSPDSLFICGSGFVDGSEPPNWEHDVSEALGVPESSIRIGYSMQEALWTMHMCSARHFHVPVTIVPYVLDETTDAPLPRTGHQTGRFAFFDLATDTSWGGYLTGDHVTITWDQPCSCGRKGAFLDSPIRKISDTQNDKVSCAGTAGALEEATDFLLNR